VRQAVVQLTRVVTARAISRDSCGSSPCPVRLSAVIIGPLALPGPFRTKQTREQHVGSLFLAPLVWREITKVWCEITKVLACPAKMRVLKDRGLGVVKFAAARPGCRCGPAYTPW
jgi:hypothetical protein